MSVGCRSLGRLGLVILIYSSLGDLGLRANCNPKLRKLPETLRTSFQRP